MADYIFIVLCTAVSLYIAYLFSFRTYREDRMTGDSSRVTFPRIIYLLVFVISFVPLLNLFFIITFAISMWMLDDEYQIKSWLFEKPGEEEK